MEYILNYKKLTETAKVPTRLKEVESFVLVDDDDCAASGIRLISRPVPRGRPGVFCDFFPKRGAFCAYFVTEGLI